jgi:hypothetical protein
MDEKLMESMSKISVRLVIDSANRQWIVGKIAARLAENLGVFGVDADIGDGPSDDVDVNHWMIFVHPWNYFHRAPGFFNAGWTPGPTRNTALITHVDDPVKVQILRESIPRILDAGICMSRMTKAELVAYGIDPARLTYILPGHDGLVQPRRVVIGITSKTFADGRKNENTLVKAAEAMRLDAFRFEIIGEGWEETAKVLRQAGAEVDLPSPSHGVANALENGYAYILGRLPAFDYYLYLGWDEGSMGTLDALAAGVKTIITPQGFHLDLTGAITHPVRNAADLIQILQGIAADRQIRLDSVKDLTWSAYAKKHALVWRALLEGRLADIPAAAGELEVSGDRPVTGRDIADARSRARERLHRSMFLSNFLNSRKFWIRAKLSRIKRWALRRS